MCFCSFDGVSNPNSISLGQCLHIISVLLNEISTAYSQVKIDGGHMIHLKWWGIFFVYPNEWSIVEWAVSFIVPLESRETDIGVFHKCVPLSFTLVGNIINLSEKYVPS